MWCEPKERRIFAMEYLVLPNRVKADGLMDLPFSLTVWVARVGTKILI